MRDVRFGLRLLARSPVFAATAILLLAIGISANTLIFSVVDALLLKPLPVPHPENLVRLVEMHPTRFVTWDLPYGLCELAAERGKNVFSEVLCQGQEDVAFSDAAGTERVRVHAVSPNFFSSLGARVLLGRFPGSDREQSAVLSYEFWGRRFRSDPRVLGRGFSLAGKAFTIVGVTERDFNGLTVDTSPDLRIPVKSIDAAPDGQIFGRLRSGVTVARASAQMDPLLHAAYDELEAQRYPEFKGNLGKIESRLELEAIPRGVSTLRTQFSRGLEVMMAAAGLLLLMACGNVAGLLLARSAGREQEIGIRLALGASTGRIARQLLTESLVLALAGGMVGTMLSYAFQPVLMRALPPLRDRAAVVQPLAVHIGIDVRVLGFAFLVTVLTAVLFGLSPALRGARAELANTLRGGRTSTRRMLARNLAVVTQVAVCTLILIGAALLVETLERMRTMDAGFDRDHVVTFTIDPGLRNYKPQQAEELSQKLLEKARTIPSVAAASVARLGLMRGTGMKGTFGVEGTRIVKTDFLNSSMNAVTPGYFETMGMRVVAGRDFTWSDENKKPGVAKVIVNQAFVRRFFAGKNPIGGRFGFSGSNGIAKADDEIIGVANDAKYRSLREPIPPTVYNPVVKGFDDGFILHLRTPQRPELLIEPVREALRSLDPEMPFIEIKTLREEVDDSLWQERLLAALTSVFAAIAALLAAIGLYGALDYAVKSRTREIGVRVALGAEPVRIAKLLLREALAMALSGLALGVCVYAAGASWMRQVLYGVRPWDAGALGAALLALGIIVVIGAGLPILRGTYIDPASALRSE